MGLRDIAYQNDLNFCGPKMIDEIEFDRICSNCKGAEQVFQWSSNVWKVGGKVFAIAGSWGDGFGITFKCSKISFELLKEEAGISPAPYLASRGFPWLRVANNETLNDEQISQFIEESYEFALANLTKKARAEITKR